MSGSILLDGEEEFCFPIHQDDLNPNGAGDEEDILPTIEANQEANPEADTEASPEAHTEAHTEANPDTEECLNNDSLFICNLCNNELQDPRQLSCYHTLCAKCLLGNATHGCLSCPVCRQQTVLPSDSLLPEPDSLIVFMMTSSETYKAACSNCENFVDFMFYCLTCKQPLCELCRQETHRAKMFSMHDIVKLSKQTQDGHKMCGEHNEEYMMYCTSRNILLCIKCFRDTDRSLRSSCVDLETAYTEHLQKVNDMIDSINDLQRALHDSILLYQALLLDVKKNAEQERAAIDALYDDVIERLTQKRLDLHKAVDDELERKENYFEEYLPELAALLPTIEKRLRLSSQFTQTMDMYEYLNLSSSLFDRLNAVLNQPRRLQPTQVSTINTDFHHEFADCLDCLLNLPRKDLPVINIEFPQERVSTENRPELSTHKRFEHPQLFSPLTGSGPFVEHCQSFESNHKLLQTQIFHLKRALETIHRDGTYHRSLVRDERVANFKDECDQVACKLASQIKMQESMKPNFEELWHQELERIAQEQDIYQNQSDELHFFQQENNHMMSIIQSIAPCISAINDISIFLDPRRAGYPTPTPEEPKSTSIYHQKPEENIPLLDTQETSNTSSCRNMSATQETSVIPHPQTTHLQNIPVTLTQKKETTQMQDTITATQIHKTKATHIQGTLATHIQDTTATQIQDTTAILIQDTTATHIQHTTATQIQDTTTTHIEDSTAKHIHDTTSTHIQDTTATCIQHTGATHLQDTAATQKQDTTATQIEDSTAKHIHDTASTHIQDTTTATCIQHTGATHLQDTTATQTEDTTATHIQHTMATYIQGMTATCIQHAGATHIQDTAATQIEDTTATHIQDTTTQIENTTATHTQHTRETHIQGTTSLHLLETKLKQDTLATEKEDTPTTLILETSTINTQNTPTSSSSTTKEPGTHIYQTQDTLKSDNPEMRYEPVMPCNKLETLETTTTHGEHKTTHMQATPLTVTQQQQQNMHTIIPEDSALKSHSLSTFHPETQAT